MGFLAMERERNIVIEQSCIQTKAKFLVETMKPDNFWSLQQQGSEIQPCKWTCDRSLFFYTLGDDVRTKKHKETSSGLEIFVTTCPIWVGECFKLKFSSFAKKTIGGGALLGTEVWT